MNSVNSPLEKANKEISTKDYQKMLSKQTVYTFEKICRIVLIVTFCAFAFLFYKVYLFQGYVRGPDNQMNYIYDLLTYGMFFSVLYTLIDFLAHHYLEELVARHFLVNDGYSSKQALQKRAYTIVKWGYSIIFYTSCSIMNIYLLTGTTYAPKWMGGQEGYTQPDKYFMNETENTFAIKILYMVEFGKHFSRLIIHSFVRQEGMYYEFTLHHMLSVALIVFSYLENIWLSGMVVLLTHDLSDAVLLLARLYKDWKHCKSFISYFFGLMSILSWSYMRGYAFLTYLVLPVHERFIYHPIEDQYASSVIYWPSFYIVMMLWVLITMDYVWIGAMVKSLSKIIFSKEKSQNKVIHEKAKLN